MKIIKTIYLRLSRYPILLGYFLSSYLFRLPWLPFWRSSFEQDPGIIFFMASWMVILSPLSVPFMMPLMGVELFLQTYKTNPIAGIVAMFLPLVYFAVLLVVSVLIIHWLSMRLSKQSVVYSPEKS